jgi:basic membrane protein A
MQAAKNHKDIEFCHATGYQAASSKLANFHNYFDNIYEARYVSGVAAGLKLKEMIDGGKITKDKAKMGYVGAYPYAEVVSGFTSFFLGAKSIVPEVTMEVKYTNSWANPSMEGETAKQLISDGCVLISQHADTTGAPTVCEQQKVPCVGYNVDMTSVAPNYALTSPTNKWAAYYKYAIKSVMDGTAIVTDWSKGFADDAVAITKLGSSVAKGTDEKVKSVEADIKSGKLHVFDTSTFTVGGKKLDSWKDKGGNEFISGGYFHESEKVSAPAFYMIIDGINAPALQ